MINVQRAILVVNYLMAAACGALFENVNASEGIAIEEANLHAISFIDTDRGWVSGERGAILHTQDGGMTWKSQPTPTNTFLVDIAMYNSQRGLAIGGATQSYTGISVGEVVITKDGGQSWEAIVGHDLPRLRKMLIGVGGKCIAVGDWSPVHLTSIFASQDGGATWQSQACNIVGSIPDIAGDINDYLILSSHGEVVRFREGVEPQTIFPSNHSSIHHPHRADDTWREVAGRGEQRILSGPLGTLISNNQGETWKAIPQSAAASLSISATDSATIESWEYELWFANATSRSITTHNGQATETIEHAGGSNIRSLLRFDRDRGWAVGEFGMILVTRDGGRSWRTIRGGNRSPAVMVVGSKPEALPWSILATESLQHQRRVAVTIDRSSIAANQNDREQIIEACSKLGPATVYISDSSPNRIREILLNAKPAVVVLDQSLTSGQRSTWAAVALESGCKRVIEVSPRGTQTVNVVAAIPAQGILASDVWFDAVSVLAPGYLPPTRLMLTAKYDSTGDLLAGDGLASCTSNQPQYGWARPAVPSRRKLQVLQARTAEMNWVQSLVATARSVEEFNSQLAIVLPRMTDEDRTRLFARLIALTAQRERPDLYLASLEAMGRYPVDSSASDLRLSELQDAVNLSRVAKLRQEAIRSSVEWRQTFGAAVITQPINLSTTSSAASPSQVDLAVQLSPFQTPASPSNLSGNNPAVGLANGFLDPKLGSNFASSSVQLASGQSSGSQSSGSQSSGSQTSGSQTSGSQTSGSQTSSAEAGVSMPAVVDLRWEFHPAVLMVNRANEQLQNNLLTLTESNSLTSSSATTNLRRIAGLPAADRWGSLVNDQRLPSTIFCPIASKPPYLDATFVEPWWSDGQVFSIDSQPAMMRLAHDDEFLYVSIDAPLLDETEIASQDRRRDTALDDSDRYRVRLDLDRDLMTAYEFEFDSTGNTRDACDGFQAFNPRWFIACKNADGRTRAEIAIQKLDIAAMVGVHDAIWNVSLDRLDKPQPSPGLSMPDSTSWLPAYLE